MKHKYYTIIGSFLVILGCIFLFVGNSEATSEMSAFDDDLDFYFSNDNFYNTTFDNIDNLYYHNIRNYTTIEQLNYTATYDFLNDDIDDTGTAISFIYYDGSTGNCLIELTDNLNGHNYICKFLDYNEATTLSLGKNFFSDTEYGTIEFWILTTDSTKDNTFSISDGATTVIHCRVDGNHLEYYDGSWHNIGITVVSNVWYHVRIDFECTAGSYKGLSQYKFHFIINGVQTSDYNFWNNQPHVDIFSFQTAAADQNYIMYIDAIGYSWNSYTIGQNIINLNETTYSDFYEVDKFEFDYNQTHPTLHDIGVDDPNGWDDYEEVGDYVNIEIDVNDVDYDRTVEFEIIDVDYGYNGLDKDDFNIEKGAINVSWSYNITVWDGLTWHYNKIYSYDSTLISEIKLIGNELFYIFDGTNYLITDSFTTNTIYDFNLFINSEYGISILRYYTDGVFSGSFIIPIIYEKDGLSKIENYIDVSVAGAMTMYLDYIGVYIDGSSISNENGWIIEKEFEGNPDFEQEIFLEYNYINFTVNGNCSLWYTALNKPSKYWHSQLINFNYYNESETFNIQDKELSGYAGIPIVQWINMTLWIQVKNHFSLYNLSIGGIKITQDIIEYFPTYEFNNVDGNTSYFYVAMGRLYYIIDFDDDGLLETMSMKIDIDNVQSVNRSCSIRSYYNGIGFTTFSVNFTDGFYVYFPFRTTPRNYNYMLIQNKIIMDFNLYVSDNNTDGLTNSTGIGYITNLRLQYIPNIALIISTIELINVMIPIIFIIVPTLMIYYRYGKGAIIPVLLLMSLIAFVSNLMPIWIFFVIIYSCGIFAIMQRKEGL